LADFDDIPEEELFSWSDFEEPDEQGYDMDVAWISFPPLLFFPHYY
jgi:hypothetical protein